VKVDPAETPAGQVAIADEADDIAVRNGGRPAELLIVGQELPAASAGGGKEFSIDELMACHFLASQKSVQLDRIGRPVGKEPNPDRGIDQVTSRGSCWQECRAPKRKWRWRTLRECGRR
jgi:hypothetical protein